MDRDRLNFPTGRFRLRRFCHQTVENDAFFSAADECVKLIELLSTSQHESNENEREE
jgi:hypothetical protein